MTTNQTVLRRTAILLSSGALVWSMPERAAAAEQVIFSLSTVLVMESEAHAVVELQRTASDGQPLSVKVFTRPGTATAGVDYEEVSQVVTFAPGELTKTVLVPILDDGLVEADETVEVLLASATDGHLLDVSPATLIILDNENGVSVDASFIPPPSLWPQRIVLQPDGKLLVSGNFWNGSSQPGICRLNTDGAIDDSFQPAGFTQNPWMAPDLAVALQSNGGILLSGGLTTVPGQHALKLARLTANGALDPSFTPAFLFAPGEAYTSVSRVVVQPDGRILVAGRYDTTNEYNLLGLSRLFEDGRRDETFAGQESIRSAVEASIDSINGLALQGDKGIILSLSGYGTSGAFGRLIRLHQDGQVDSNFHSEVRTGRAGNLTIDAQNRILVTGYGSGLNDESHWRFLRFNQDGQIDSTFSPSVTTPNGGDVESVAVLPDGNLVIAGFFDRVNGVPRRSLARLKPDGTLDLSFRGPARFACGDSCEASLSTALVQPDGKIVVLGGFTSADGYPRENLARVLPTPGAIGGPEFKAPTYLVDETAGDLFIPLRRTGDTSLPAQVRLRTVDLTATAGQDYESLDILLTFPALVSEQFATLRIINDALVDPFERLQLVLEPVELGGTLGAQSVTEINISDNDVGIFFPASFVFANENDSTALIGVSRYGDDTGAVTLNYTVTGGSATPGLDYVGTSGTVSFAAGETETTFSIPLLDDGLAEGEESVELVLSDPLNRSLLSSSTNVTLRIRDNERPGVRLDLRFTPDLTGFEGAQVLRFRPAPDEKVLVELQLPDGSWNFRTRVLRLNADGTRDESFHAAGEDLTLFAVQPDGRVLCLSSNRVIRLEQSGAIDTTFQVAVDSAEGLVPEIRKILVQPDGKILILGNFTAVVGVGRTKLARLNPNGTLDEDFVPGTSFEGDAVDMVLAPAGQVFVGSHEFYWGGSGGPPPASKISVVKLNADGSIDPTFIHAEVGSWGLSSLALQPDGKLLLTLVTGGKYYSAAALSRINSDGTPDDSFSTGDLLSGQYVGISAVAVQKNGSIYLAWSCGNCWSPGSHVVRLKSDGSLDRSFEPSVGTEGGVSAFYLLSDDYALVGGWFTTYDGIWRPGIARIQLNTPPAVTVGFASPAAAVLEGAGVARVAVNRFGDATGTLTFGFSVRGGSAVPGVDFEPMDGTVVFPPLVGSTTIEIPVFDNPWPEADRTIVVELRPFSDQWQLGPPADRMTLRLLDDDRPGSVDGSFNAGDVFANVDNPGSVLAVIVEPDQKILVGGTFSSVAGIPLRGIARLLPDGTLDESYVKGVGIQPEYASVSAMARLESGQVLIGGWFNSLNGVGRANVARLNTDGSADLNFDAGSIAASGSVSALAVQADGKVLLGGQMFNATNGGLIRLLPNGAYDAAFAPKFPSDATVSVIRVLRDGNILVGGYFTSVNEQPVSHLARLRPNGTLDTSFDARSAGINWLKALAVQADGRLLVCGAYDGATNPLRRLMENGAVDPSFDSQIAGAIGDAALAVQQDGRILVTGDLTFRDGTQTQGLTRLNPDGSLDRSFGPTDVYAGGASLTVQEDGSILLAGMFQTVNGLPRTGLVRLNGAEPPYGFSQITWHPVNGAVLTLRGLPGNRYLVERSIDLRTWLRVGEVVLSERPAEYSVHVQDTEAGSFERRFYRASRQPPSPR